ncbi:MAG: hypothetical protein JO306_07900, partial [Gemmatimonadetes bacterium]|nr:hypothetical protein [Gemmatimonadota bacterium]
MHEAMARYAADPTAVREALETPLTTATHRAGIAARGSAGGVRQRVRDYVTLTKPRI